MCRAGRSYGGGGLFGYGGGVSGFAFGRSAVEDACWTLPPFLCFGCSDAPGQGRRPAFAAAAAFGPVCAGLRQGPTGPSVPNPTPGVGCTAMGRGKGSSSVRMEPLAGVICPSLPVRPGARGPPTPGFIKRTGYREDLGAGPIRPLYRYKERLPPEGGFPCKRLSALRGFHMER